MPGSRRGGLGPPPWCGGSVGFEVNHGSILTRSSGRFILGMCGLPYKVRSGHPSPYGSVIRGQGRRVDVAVLPGGQPLLFWNANGKTFQEVRRIKIFRALEEAKRDRLFGVHSVIVFGGEGWTQEVEQWAMGEGMSREEWFEAWIRRFFCSKRRLFWPRGPNTERKASKP